MNRFINFAVCALLFVNAMARAEDAYLHSDGTQYINTRYVIKPDTRIEIDLQLDSTGTGDQYLFGTYGSQEGVLAFCSYTTKDGRYNYCCRKNSSDWKKTACATTTERRTVVLDGYNNRYSILADGVTNYTEAVTGAHDGCDSGVTMPVFAGYNLANKSYGGLTPCKLFSLKIYESDGLVADFRPCLSDGDAGLRDAVSGTFLVPANGKTIAYGGDIEIVDAGYIQSSGEQYIDTGYKAKANSRIEIDMAFTDSDKIGNTYPFGVSHDSSGLIFGMFVNSSGYCGWNCADTAANWGMFTYSADLKRHTFVVDAANGMYCVVTHGVTNRQGTITSTYTGETLRSLFLFASRRDGVDDFNATMKLYGFKAYEDGVLVRNYVPCVKGGVAGLKETVSGQFYGGISTDVKLSAGGNVMRETDDPYVEGDGFQAFNTDVYVDSTTRIELDFAPPRVNMTTAKYFLGSHTEAQGNLVFGAYIKDSIITVNCQKDKGNWQGVGTVPNHRQRLVVDIPNRKSSVYVNGLLLCEKTITADCGTADAPLTTKYPSPLLGTTASGGEPTSILAARVYGFKVYRNGVLVHDYRPYVQDCVVGLRDSVTSDFIGSPRLVKGFRAGGDIPANVEEDAFLSSDQRQAINTGYVVNEKSCVEVDFAFNQHTNALERIFGSTSGGDYRFGVYADSQDATWGTYRFAAGPFSEETYYLGSYFIEVKRHSAIIDMPNKRLSLLTGSTTNASRTIATMPSGTVWPMGLFGEPADAEFTAAQKLSNLRIYSVRISENGVPVHHYLPYKNGDTVGLKDVITGAVKTDMAGSGAPFTVGGRGWGDGHEAFYEEPADAALFHGGTAELSAFAPGAVSYQWLKNGEEMEGETGMTCSVPWRRDAGDEIYSVRAAFDRYGVLVYSVSGTATVSHKPVGMRIVIQ